MKLLVDLSKFGVADKVVMLDHKAVAQTQMVIAEAATQCGSSIMDTSAYIAGSMLIRGMAAAGVPDPSDEYEQFMETRAGAFADLIRKCLNEWERDGASTEDYVMRTVWQLVSVGFGCGFAYGIDSFAPTGKIPNIPRDVTSPEKQAWARTFIASCPREDLRS